MERSDIPLVKRAFHFFDENHITAGQLAERLRREFDESRCISVNEEKEKENQQILLNTLEEKDNRIRAIFAVQKLNEGWDVLNLFDIVRCYTVRDSKAGKPGKTTIAEAQLIGRGARYSRLQPMNTMIVFSGNMTITSNMKCGFWRNCIIIVSMIPVISQSFAPL
ncbi:MAG: hypothetical protein JKP90_00085 [Desulfofustis sp. PB-SRB1]|nr:hypothetical protein [Desulfofustis sp. PB-SRB1]